MNKQWYWLAGFIIIGVLLGASVLILVTRPPRGSPITLLPAPSPAPIMVYVSGRVNYTGVYSLPSGSRVNDAIQAAGGFSENANAGALNLAKILVDGEQVDVPEAITSTIADGSSILPNLPFNLVNINTASLEQLDTLPGIGPITDQGIINYRDANGPFAGIDEIINVPRIGQATFDKIKDLITVGTSP